MQFSSEVNEVSPLITLDRAEHTISFSLQYHLNGYYDDYFQEVVYHGNVSAYIDSFNGSDEAFVSNQNILSITFDANLSPNILYQAGYLLHDVYYGTLLDVSFNIAIYDVAVTTSGTAGIDVFFGSEEGDSFVGGNSNDRIDGAGGNDVLNGGSGADLLIGGTGIDTAVFSASTAGVLVNLYYGIGRYGDAEGDTYSSIENVVGSSFNDIIRGSSGRNTLEGGDGNDQLLGDANTDILRGGAGNDLLVGGAGNDTLEGGLGFDTIDYSASSSRVLINLYYSNALQGDAQGDTFTSIENVWGSAFNDIIRGSAGANILRGGAGGDTLTGDGGADYFQYNSAAFGNDLITDFADGADKLDFRGSGLLAVNMVVQVSLGDTFVSFTGNAGQAIKLDNFVGTFNASDCLF